MFLLCQLNYNAWQAGLWIKIMKKIFGNDEFHRLPQPDPQPYSYYSVKTVSFLKGGAILLSSLILCIGFGVLMLSRFVPTMNFGMLSAIIMITAVIGDLVVLPSIILCKRGAEDKKIFYRQER